MALQDYTTEELKAEIKRRQDEERKARSRKGMKAEYAYAEAIVTYATAENFCRRVYNVTIVKQDVARLNIPSHRVCMNWLKVDTKVFRSSNAPNKGDTVKLKSRITKNNPNGFGLFSTPIICEIIKRARED